MQLLSNPSWFKIHKHIVCFVLMSSLHSLAFEPISGSSQLLDPKEIDTSGYLQFLPSEINFIAELAHATPYREVNTRHFIGLGGAGFLIGSFIKWIPFPDYRYQPALGTALGASYNWFDSQTHYMNVHFHPSISKVIETGIGDIIPYLTLPFSMKIKNLKEFEFPLKITFGLRAELVFIHAHKVEVVSEISMNLVKPIFSAFNIGVISPWPWM